MRLVCVLPPWTRWALFALDVVMAPRASRYPTQRHTQLLAGARLS
jgi:hypothetical protein